MGYRSLYTKSLYDPEKIAIAALQNSPQGGGGAGPVIFELEAVTTGTGATITYDDLADLAALEAITGNPGEFAYVANDADPPNNGTYQWSEDDSYSSGLSYNETFGWRKRTPQKLSLPAYVAGSNGETVINVKGVPGGDGSSTAPKAFIKLPSAAECATLELPDR